MNNSCTAQINERWARGLERASLDVEPLSSTSCGSMKQLGAKKRRKLQSSEGVGCETPSLLRAGQFMADPPGHTSGQLEGRSPPVPLNIF
ncbi:hypothetical protein [Thermoleptolyngbya sp.]